MKYMTVADLATHLREIGPSLGPGLSFRNGPILATLGCSGTGSSGAWSGWESNNYPKVGRCLIEVPNRATFARTGLFGSLLGVGAPSRRSFRAKYSVSGRNWPKRAANNRLVAVLAVFLVKLSSEIL